MEEMEQTETSTASDYQEGDIETLLDDAKNMVEKEFSSELMEEEEQPHTFREKLKDFFESIILPVLYGVLISLLLTQVLFFHAKVPTGSMETTILTGDRIVGNRMVYWFQDPDYGDIIIFWSAEYNEFMVKRVIGKPGDLVELREDGVYVNDRRISDTYTQGETRELQYGIDTWTVPAESYFVMGDNRENSADSRYWENAFVPRDEIYARYMFRYSLGRNGWYLDWKDDIVFWAES